MKKILMLVIAITSCQLFAGENYILEINGEIVQIGLGKGKRFTMPDGTKLNLKLTLKEYITFETENYSFSHKSTFRPERKPVGEGVYQTMLTTALGSGIIIQEYTTMDPTSIVDFMLNELTKEERDYGYQYKERVVSQMAGTKKLVGKEAITTHTEDQWIRAVYAYGNANSGIMVVTFIERDNLAGEQQILTDLWESLKIK